MAMMGSVNSSSSSTASENNKDKIPQLKTEQGEEQMTRAATSEKATMKTTTSTSQEEQQQHERNVKDFITHLLRSRSGGGSGSSAPGSPKAAAASNIKAAPSYQWKSRDAYSLLNSSSGGNSNKQAAPDGGVSDFLKSVDAFIDRHCFSSSDGGGVLDSSNINIDDLAGKFQSDTSFDTAQTKTFLGRFKSSDWKFDYGPHIELDNVKGVFDSTESNTKPEAAAVAGPVAAAAPAAAAAGNKAFADKFKSTDWKQQYESSHVDIDPGKVFSLTSSSEGQPPQQQEGPVAAAPATKAPPTAAAASKKKPSGEGGGGGGGTDWNAMFEQGLPSASSSSNSAANKAHAVAMSQQQMTNIMSSSGKASTAAMVPTAAPKTTSADLPSMPPLKDATALPAPTITSIKALDLSSTTKRPTSNNPKSKSSPPRSATKRKKPTSSKAGNRKSKKDPDIKVYYEPSDNDVLLGRGGRTNHHIGNKRYLKEKLKIQPRYLAATKEEKTGISQELVDAIHGTGGRFLEHDSSCDKWFEVTPIKARKKASQTLRELNTAEERAAKRAKYNR